MTTICPKCGAELKSNPDCSLCRDAWTKALNEETANGLSDVSHPNHSYIEVVSHGPPRANALQVLLGNIYALTPRAYVTSILIGVNVAVFVLMVMFGVSPMRPTVEDLVRWGANYGLLVIDGQWWRTFTCMFVHVGFIHILFNMWVLKDGGPLVERMVGNLGFLCLYLISGLTGSLGSLLWNPVSVSAGASGAVFGVYGALVGILLRQRRSIPMEALTPLRNSGLAFVGYNLVFGAMIPNIDMAAHIGGLIGGFLCGLVLSQPFNADALAHRFSRNMLTIALGVVLMAGCCYAITSIHGSIPGYQKDATTFVETEVSLREKFNTAYDKLGKHEISETALSDLILKEILPDWRASTEKLEKHQNLPSRLETQQKSLVDYAKLRQDAWQLMAEALRDGDQDKWVQASEKNKLANEYAQKR